MARGEGVKDKEAVEMEFATRNRRQGGQLGRELRQRVSDKKTVDNKFVVGEAIVIVSFGF